MFVYGLIDPFSKQLRYVGKTEVGASRPKAHWTSHKNRNDRCHTWVRSILNKESIPEVEILQSCNNRNELNDAEMFWIGYLKMTGCRLTNMTPGGDGVAKGNTPWNKGATYSSPAISKAKRGVKTRPCSDEVKRKISESLKGRTHSAERVEKIAAAHRGKKQSKEQVEKFTKSIRSYWDSSESAEHRQILSDNMKKMRVTKG